MYALVNIGKTLIILEIIDITDNLRKSSKKTYMKADIDDFRTYRMCFRGSEIIEKSENKEYFEEKYPEFMI